MDLMDLKDIGGTLLTADNLIRAFGQLLVVVAATELGLRLLRPTSARLRLACWRLAILAGLLLPLLSVREVHRVAGDGAVFTLQLETTTRGALAAAFARVWISQVSSWLIAGATQLPWLLLAGIIARAAWLGLGFARLSWLRAESHAIDVNTTAALDLDALTHTLAAPYTQVRWHDAVTQPITFGLFRPLILLPRRLVALPPAAQRAIICHELLHVARRDWAWTLAEEALQTLLWWHPAVWWALAQIQLQREQIIDAQVVAITAARQPYMHALLAFADATPPVRPVAAPVVPFIRRRHLAARLEQLVQEVPMSQLRLTSAAFALAALIAATSWVTVSAMPLQAAAPADKPAPAADKPAPGDKPLDARKLGMKPKILKQVKADYPQDAKDAKIQGNVDVEIRIAKDGTVAETKVVKSIPTLDKAATDAVKQWKFEPTLLNGKPVEVMATMTIRFALK
jgi:TonB family protein